MRAVLFGMMVAVPVLAQAPAPQAELDRLFALLRQAPSEAAAAPVAARIEHALLNGASPVVTLLVQRGMRNMQAQAWSDAVADFDAALDLAPDYPEGWHRRAMARFMMGDADGAARDLQEVLRREPRHFPALVMLARVAEARGDPAAAFRAFEAALAVYPHLPDGAARLRELRRKAFGEAL